MTLPLPARALVLFISLLLTFSGPAMALTGVDDAAPASHGSVDSSDHCQDRDTPEACADCGADHCSPGLFPRFSLAESSATPWFGRPVTHFRPPPPHAFYKPPRAQA